MVVDASGERCEAIRADAVDCRISLEVAEQVTRVVRYQAPLVADTIQIAGSTGLVARQFAPVVPYRITVQP